MEIRRLAASERDAWLALLDGWPLPDGWRGREFFRRPIDHDPTYRDEDVWVATDGGALVATAQIFPRRIHLGGAVADLGGIGSVYTRPESRSAGISSALLERCARDMAERGMSISLLFTSRLAFYARLGWQCWGVTRALVRRTAEAMTKDPGAEIAAFDPAGDFDEVAALYGADASRRAGPMWRDTDRWRTTLALGGNPAEEFAVARRDGAITAYVRATCLSGVLLVTEIVGDANVPDAAGDAADLVGRLFGGRARDVLAPPGKTSEEFRAFAAFPVAPDPALEASLAARGLAVSRVEDPGVMLRCLDAAALERQTGTPRGAGEDDTAYLRRLAPPDAFSYWPSDRF